MMGHQIKEDDMTKATIQRKFIKGDEVKHVGAGDWYGRKGVIVGYTSPTRFQVQTTTQYGTVTSYTCHADDLEAA
jgi:hypothetical protein